jgi:hypothetical protein
MQNDLIATSPAAKMLGLPEGAVDEWLRANLQPTLTMPFGRGKMRLYPRTAVLTNAEVIRSYTEQRKENMKADRREQPKQPRVNMLAELRRIEGKLDRVMAELGIKADGAQQPLLIDLK